MNIIITTFKNPFCFYCLAEEDAKDIEFVEESVETSKLMSSKIDVVDVTHGQYVAVMWKNKWARGLVTMEKQFLIWLIDYGMYLKPNEKTVYTDLPPTYKKLPTKLFEASIHGVAPIDRVIGDLYLEIDRKIVNIIDELALWPIFLERNATSYMKNLSAQYTTRRKHRSCLLKPAIAGYNLPTMSPETTVEEYDAICAVAPEFVYETECDNSSAAGSTVIEYTNNKAKEDPLKLTAAEMEKYSNMYVTIHHRKYNVLNVLINKIRDLNMCEKYKNHDHKSVGRGYYRNRQIEDN
ncbi:hypothetical protein ACJJTC_012149 [Scirpophaga incertulas]